MYLSRQTLNTDWQSLWLQPSGFVPEDNHTIIFNSNASGSESDFSYQLNWGTVKALIGSGAIVVGTGLTGNGTAGNPARIIPGTALNDTLLWNGTTWTVGQIPGSNTAFPITGTGTLVNPIRLVNGTAVGDILQWNGASWVIVPEIRYQVFTPVDNQTIFTLTIAPLTPLTVEFYINTHKQIYGVDFNIAGTTLTYISTNYAINSTDIVEVYY